MKLKEIHRTSTFAWSPTTSLPLLATGTAAGALDESFSNDSQLEIWQPDFLDRFEFDLGGEGHPGPKAVVKTSSRFNRISWGAIDTATPQGVIAAGMENGELALWDPTKILAGADENESVILRNSTHKGPVRGLDFNTLSPNLLSSGATNGEIFVWNLQEPTKPYHPGTRSSKLDEITALQWNKQVNYVLGTASSTGYTVVWDLRGKREVVALAYNGGGNAGPMMGGRKGMSDIAWHPDNATRVATASEDDSTPIIMLWDLRNARAPEKILEGHTKGVLSLSWCKQDADLLLSCGKDNRALAWNPSTSTILGELPVAHNWAFQVSWCPRNPDLLATAAFDGTIGLHSLQNTNEIAQQQNDAASQTTDADNFFDTPSTSFQTTTLSLKQPPKWLRRPVCATFGFGGMLVTTNNLQNAAGQHQSAVVHLRKVITEQGIVGRARKLLEASKAGDKESVKKFAEDVGKDAKGEDSEAWKALLSLFDSTEREQLIRLLGFSKDEVEKEVSAAIEKLGSGKPTGLLSADSEVDITESNKSVVTFAEPPKDDVEGEGEGDGVLTPPAEATPSERSISATSDRKSVTASVADSIGAEAESTTEPSLFDDEALGAVPQTDAASDFFATLGANTASATGGVEVPHLGYGLDSSVAPTVGSGPPSTVGSDSFEPESFRSSKRGKPTFQIYPDGESSVDRLVSKALVLGDFNSAVQLCLSTERYADAILLAVKGGPELLAKTQKAYFAKRTNLRLFQSIVAGDLGDIVKFADIKEWREIFVILCTFAGKDDFAGLTEQLGERLEVRAKELRKGGGEKEGREWRKNATLCYLAAGKLEKVVGVWIEEMGEWENESIAQGTGDSRYQVHSLALQTLMERVSVFRSAVGYVDPDLSASAAPADHKLAPLYDRYLEYADILATQGLVTEAVEYVKLTPEAYHGAAATATTTGDGVEDNAKPEGQRERVLKAAGLLSIAAPAPAAPAAAATSSSNQATVRGQPARGAYAGYGQQQQSTRPQIPSSYEPYNPPQPAAYPAPSQQGPYAPPAQQQQQQQHNPYAPVNPPNRQQYEASGPMQYQDRNSGYPNGNANAYPGGGGGNYPPPRAPSGMGGMSMVPPPPAPFNTGSTPPMHGGPPSGAPTGPPPQRIIPAAQRRDLQGWNDAPVVAQRHPTPQQQVPQAPPQAITAPFPNAPGSPVVPNSPYYQHGQPASPLPPPPRGSTRTPSQAGGPPPPGPPRAGQHQQQMPPPPQQQHQQTGAPPPGPYGPPPQQPGRMMQPGGIGGPPQGPASRPASRGPPPPGPPRAGPPLRGQTPQQPPPPQQQQHHQPPPPSGPYAPPPGQQQQQQGPPQQYQQQQAPPPQGQPGPYGPPPGAQRGPPPPGPPQGGGGGPPPPPGRPVSSNGAAAPAPAPPPPAKVPAGPKYPPGDRSHIPDSSKPAYEVLSDLMNRMKQTTPPQQKRMVEDTERRINALFDALNCETLSQPVVDQLMTLVGAMQARDQQNALAIHLDLLTKGSKTDDIVLWMTGVKQLILRLHA